MSQMCIISACAEPSFTVCNCCERPMCKSHITEHYNFLTDHWNNIVNDIKVLDECIKSFDASQATIESREKLEQWRAECHEKIDQMFEKKSQELDQCVKLRVDQQKQNLEQLQSKLPHMVGEKQTTLSSGDLSSLILTVDQLKRDMIRIQQTHIQIRSCPLMLEDSMLQIIETIRPPIDIANLPPVCKTLEHSSKSYCVMASNDKYLLIHQAPNLCLVSDEMKIVQQTFWPFDNIVDLSWSTTLEQFILLNDHYLFLLNEGLTRVEKIPTRQMAAWVACACSDTALFISTDEQVSSIFVFQLIPTIKYTKRWQHPASANDREQIDSMGYSNGTLGLVVRSGESKSLRFELRFDSTFDCLWSLSLETNWTKKIPFRSCSLSFDEWLVADYQSDSLIHITKWGQIKAAVKYPVTPYHAHLFQQHSLVVLTKSGKNFHRFS